MNAVKWLKSLFKATAVPVEQVSNPFLHNTPAAIIQAAPKLVTAETAQLKAEIGQHKFQTVAAVRQATEYATSLQRAQQDLAGAREELQAYRLVCYCKRMGMICVSPECREDGCIRKRMEQDASTETSRP